MRRKSRRFKRSSKNTKRRRRSSKRQRGGLKRINELQTSHHSYPANIAKKDVRGNLDAFMKMSVHGVDAAAN